MTSVSLAPSSSVGEKKKKKMRGDAVFLSNSPSQNPFRSLENEISLPSDPIYPWICSITTAADDYCQNPQSGVHLHELLEECINCFENEDRYRDDARFLNVWLLYADAIQDFGKVFRKLEEKKICQTYSRLYGIYALFLEVKGQLAEANAMYKLGISRNAEPLENLQRMHASFLNRMRGIVNACSLQKIDTDETVNHGHGINFVSPWSMSTTNDLLKKIDTQIMKYKGYYKSAKVYSGKVSISSLRNSSRNKVIELGGIKYQIKGCSGQGAFAQVFKAHVDNNPDDVVALKIQMPAFPWEFYMYRQLDKRIPDEERSSFGLAYKAHIYSDCSILVCEYLDHGTLQDAINSYLVIGQTMEEVLCIYYSIEMLRILETLHNVGIIHGDFKPDNLLVRNSRDSLSEDGFHGRTGAWRDQGLCLVDWGRGIDLNLFPDGTEFKGDSRTSGFRCVEMQENRPWTFQKALQDGSYLYQPKSSLKRYWNVDLWRSLFTQLLNISSSSDNYMVLLRSLRKSFEDYMYGSPQQIKKLKMLLVKQQASLCPAT
ncbi:mitotic checkpoint serine/threonine-protein kinase BUB1-like isoform X2 [Magnolia sinica]|uniref:mitotic checkpoint serine/threonine-protein kinase BUB1-like isoform X2 n=1 Tax=Magnolia sinica TaxID=86752 RepID=UPI0026584479|nr:mitotic checkpoint serine/threonine-protein kinase BUB1-like isoform X2 [Magnolia sinica]